MAFAVIVHVDVFGQVHGFAIGGAENFARSYGGDVIWIAGDPHGVDTVASGQGQEEGDPPFLLELAHYEWMELVLDASTEEFPQTGFHPEGDLLRAIPQLSPLHVVLSYQYPVHEICVDFQPQSPLAQPLWLLDYRDREDQVRFMEINAPTARLLQLIEENPDSTGFQVVGQLAEELQFADLEKLAAFARDILQQMHQRDILIGASLKSC